MTKRLIKKGTGTLHNGRNVINLRFEFNSRIDLWCNGNTPGFGPGIQGSSPCRSTKRKINLCKSVTYEGFVF